MAYSAAFEAIGDFYRFRNEMRYLTHAFEHGVTFNAAFEAIGDIRLPLLSAVRIAAALALFNGNIERAHAQCFNWRFGAQCDFNCCFWNIERYLTGLFEYAASFL